MLRSRANAELSGHTGPALAPDWEFNLPLQVVFAKVVLRFSAQLGIVSLITVLIPVVYEEITKPLMHASNARRPVQ